jgi:hypothetical protein
VAVLAVAVAAGACADALAPGSAGTFRLAGRAKGEAPLNLLPPVSDRSGNIYVLYGGIDLPETIAYVGKRGGGWVSGCNLTKGDVFGAHGWVGFDEETQWYWSGDALVSVSGRTGDCHRVLDRDPGTDTSLLFRAVLPWVHDSPSRTTLVALVQSPVDPLPFSTRIDLQAEIVTNVNAFDPPDAKNVRVLGVGANRENREGAVLLQFERGDTYRTEARFFDEEAVQIGVTRLSLPQAAREHEVLGFLQVTTSGLAAGLLRSGEIVTFDKAGGRVTKIDSMTPVGVHKWQDALHVVGTRDGHPVVSRLDDRGTPGPVAIWSASEVAAGALRGPLEIRDDRALPSRTTAWATARTAMGDFPFVHAHSSNEYSVGTTLWLAAGPSFDTGGAKVTAFAVVPIGVSYP